jgi:hypothetical protein
MAQSSSRVIGEPEVRPAVPQDDAAVRVDVDNQLPLQQRVLLEALVARVPSSAAITSSMTPLSQTASGSHRVHLVRVRARSDDISPNVAMPALRRARSSLRS